ncbi:MAG: DUF3006 domain-containing protein [Actinobacteria bacterium]|nr:DUF3006 domain-containing protein [Actinomycetota bacterium]
MTPGLYCYLDRFEGDLAVILADDEEKIIASSLLPPGAREGDHLFLSITVDIDARNRTADEISRLQQDLETEGGLP